MDDSTQPNEKPETWLLEDVLQECLDGGSGCKVTWYFDASSDREPILSFNKMNCKVRSNHRDEVKLILKQSDGEVIFENISPAVPAPDPVPAPVPAPVPVPDPVPAPAALGCDNVDCDSLYCEGVCEDLYFEGSSDT